MIIFCKNKIIQFHVHSILKKSEKKLKFTYHSQYEQANVSIKNKIKKSKLRIKSKNQNGPHLIR